MQSSRPYRSHFSVHRKLVRNNKFIEKESSPGDVLYAESPRPLPRPRQEGEPAELGASTPPGEAWGFTRCARPPKPAAVSVLCRQLAGRNASDTTAQTPQPRPGSGVLRRDLSVQNGNKSYIYIYIGKSHRTMLTLSPAKHSASSLLFYF